MVKKSKGLSFNTGIGRKPFVFWGYHVAAGVIIKNETYIFDPWTKNKLVKLEDWALSFFNKQIDNNLNRTSYIFPVLGLYKFYGTSKINKLSTDKIEWDKNLDPDLDQMYCGLCGITPNSKCDKRKSKKLIKSKKIELSKYLEKSKIKF